MLGDVPHGQPVQEQDAHPQKTNLMVFLHRIVLRDALATDALALDRYDLMRGVSRPRSRRIGPAQPGPAVARSGGWPRRPASADCRGTDRAGRP